MTEIRNSDETRLGRGIIRQCQAHPEQSGFFPLVQGSEAFLARIRLAEIADRNIDVQYYFIVDDVTGVLFIDALLQAADRGVHVRLLLDDVRTKGKDLGLAALDAHPQFEIRIFNPFSRRELRFFDVVTDFDRVNRRMHNKSITVDKQVTIVGGRNIGDEYFDARADLNFGDLDLLGVGPIAQDVSTAFEHYWRSKAAVPIESFAKYRGDRASLTKLREQFTRRVESAMETDFATAAATEFDYGLEDGSLQLDWAPAELVYDLPDQVAAQMGRQLRPMIETSMELLLVSPYFVPQADGVAMFSELCRHGGRVVIVTNSLASTDVAAVHAGYARYREEIVKAGVELWEIKPDLETRRMPTMRIGSSRSSLHAKFFIRDRQQMLVGSFNWDPRSIRINTEMGILVHSDEIAAPFAGQLLSRLPEFAYRVTLNDKGRLQWLYEAKGESRVFDREPQTGFWRRATAAIFGLFPFEGQL